MGDRYQVTGDGARVRAEGFEKFKRPKRLKNLYFMAHNW